MQTTLFLSSIFFRYFTRQITRENKSEGKEEGTPTAKSWLFAYRSEGQLRQRSKILMLIVEPYPPPYLICILMPRDWFPTAQKEKPRGRRKKKILWPREEIQLVHSNPIVPFISHLTNFSFVFADLNRGDSPKINIMIQKNIFWLPSEKKNTRLTTPLHTRAHTTFSLRHSIITTTATTTTTWWISTEQMKKMKGTEGRNAQTKPLPDFFFFACCLLNHNQADIKRTTRNLYTSKPYYIYRARNTRRVESKKTKRKKTEE